MEGKITYPPRSVPGVTVTVIYRSLMQTKGSRGVFQVNLVNQITFFSPCCKFYENEVNLKSFFLFTQVVLSDLNSIIYQKYITITNEIFACCIFGIYKMIVKDRLLQILLDKLFHMQISWKKHHGFFQFFVLNVHHFLWRTV